MKGFGNPTDTSALCRLTQHVFATYTSKHAPVVAETLRPMMQKLCFFFVLRIFILQRCEQS